ncbi:Oxysterol-binding protein [Trametes versicolor FP-101664 SS1]|uniref:Oxysterol-binding protein n=1 Tax=Trametes versicolor (strain FP-101664) TaxID=717944 RepID=UPI000462132F|nr:Oxysterol-binding protein [Trametes versicolor FP-101664 SS1]EIW65283.1 Oxysterol-binding protein [Trametes versicolor FP-101664 SS1]
MMGLFNQAAQKVYKPRGSSEDDKAPEDTEPDDTSILDENEGSIIASLISQLRVGMDLHKVTFPTFVLEPRSMLERITDFMSHPDLLFGQVLPNCDDPEERFIRVLQYYLAGWHIKPKGVKKPYNPVLGEFFRCRYDYPDGSRGFYIAEQVSHHPPVSAFYYVSPANKVAVIGELRPKSKFLGNSVSTTMEGENRVYLLGRPDDKEYVVSMPNMYARGILWGKMFLELGDSCMAKNEQTGHYADIQFKTKGYFSGTYNAIAGKIRRGNTETGEVSGKWSALMEYKSSKPCARVQGEKRVLFDAAKDGQNIAPKWVAPEDEQEPDESRRMWSKLTRAIVAKDMDAATEAKTAVEESQREARRRMDERGEVHVPRFFQERNGRWEPKLQLPSDPQEAIQAVEKFIWPTLPPSYVS